MKTPNWHLLLMRILWFAVFGAHGLTVQAMTEEYDPTKGPGAKRYAINWNPSGTKAFDPVACKHREAGYEGHIYWAAGKQVFRFRYHASLPIFPMADKDIGVVSGAARKEIPSPPDSTEPEGCYLNPLRAGSVPYMNRFAVDMYERLWGKENFFHGNTWLTSFKAIPINDRSPSMRTRYEERTSCRIRKSGMEECWTPRSEGKSDYLSPRVYRIDRDLFPKHVGMVDVFCWSSRDYSTYIESNCDARVFDVVFVGVSLSLYYSIKDGKDPAVDLNLPYFEALITYLINANVSNYRWSVTK